MSADLGPLVRRFAGRGFGWRDLWSLALPGTLGVLAPLGYGLQRSDYAYAQYGPVAADFWGRPWFALAALAAIIFALLLLYRLLLRRTYVAIHQEGLHLHLRPFHNRSIRFNQIAGIATAILQDRFLGLALHTAYQAVLYPNVGRPIRLNESLAELPELSACIKERLYAQLKPRLHANLAAGQWLYFGPLSIQAQGIRLPRRWPRRSGPTIPWKALERITVQSGYLMVELNHHARSGRLKPIPVSHIPNLEILLDLLQQGVTA